MRTKFPNKIIEFFVFSDDIESVKKSSTFLLDRKPQKTKILFVSENKEAFATTSSLDDFILMTLFPHLIISNSTFSWWAAYLIPNLQKVIIAPTFHPRFFDHYKSSELRNFKKKLLGQLWYPSSWTVLNPYVYASL